MSAVTFSNSIQLLLDVHLHEKKYCVYCLVSLCLPYTIRYDRRV